MNSQTVPQDPILNRLVAEIEAVFEVHGIYLHGSAAEGALHENSDIDLACLFPKPPEPEQMLTLLSRLESIAGRQVDIADLYRASPVLMMQVFRKGRKISVRDRRAVAFFEMSIPSRYEDLKITQRPIEKAFINRVRNGGS